MTRVHDNREFDPDLLLMQALAGRTEGIIEESEARGQQSLVNSDSLPSEMSDKTRSALEAAGVTFGEPYLEDPLFLDATLPAGWAKRATSHDMWSYLVDDQGMARAGIFYKAAFYDRRAHLDVITPRPFEEVAGG